MAVLFNGAHEEICRILHTLPITIMMINQNTAAHGNNETITMIMIMMITISTTWDMFRIWKTICS